MSRRGRLDAELVRRGLARSRGEAAELVAAGQVQVQGHPTAKAATVVSSDTTLRVCQSGERYASRGARKLLGALEAWPEVNVTARRCLDAGASTGGFTDLLLRRGAASVIAVDVGYGQLDWRLRIDPRVRVLDRTNVRQLSADDIGGQVQLTVADLSFISLRTVLPALIGVTAEELIVLVKPQFEVGRERLGPKGVVRDPTLRLDAVASVAQAATALGLTVAGVAASPLPGPAGNVEYFLHLTVAPAVARDPAELRAALAAAVIG